MSFVVVVVVIIINIIIIIIIIITQLVFHLDFKILNCVLCTFNAN